MKYYIIAGEASGDLHGSSLIRALRAIDPEAEVRCWGGDRMEEAGGVLVKHIRETAYMGFVEVVTHLHVIAANIKFCKRDIETFRPDALIFIDYSGFNLRIAQWAKPKGFRTHYYISPQLWASRADRIEKIKRDIDHMYVILPFEKDFYSRHGYEVDYVGHPLLDAISQMPESDRAAFCERNGLDPGNKLIALLPGSRIQEIDKILPVMLAIVPHFEMYQFVLGAAPNMASQQYQKYIGELPVQVVRDETYTLLSHSHAALVTSGTATLETALFKVPQVVCYKGNWISYQIAKRLITLDYISLVNLIMEEEIVKELIQKELRADTLRSELDKILDGPARKMQKTAYNLLEGRLGSTGASSRAAELIYKNSMHL